MKFILNIAPEAEETVVATVHQRNILTDKLQELVLRYTGEDQLPGYTEDNMRMLRYSEIQLITVEDGKTMAIDGNGDSYRLKLRLYELEERLPDCFIRINKSALINEKHLVRFTSGFSGAVDAVLRCGKKEYVSRRCYAEIKRRYNGK